ncbi:hypothetical protein [Falsibacillus pallidus]|uniref:hypothetical protein n=1 Tax=Falsibacillus pallidus TaxID=493781 RepID=UPI003D9846DF
MSSEQNEKKLVEDQNTPCGCGVPAAPQQPNQEGCTNAVSQQVCVEAVVTITPTVTPGTPMVACVGLPSVGTTCADLGFTPSTTVPGSCTTSFAQVLCVTMPLTFNADVVATPGGVGCGPAFNAPNCPVV